MKVAAKYLNLNPSDVLSLEIVRQALDARARRAAPTWKLTLDLELRSPPPKRALNRTRPRPEADHQRLLSPLMPPKTGPVVVVGAGPAGIFCAWHLAERGAEVHLIERGKPVETRARDFGRFRGRGELNPESNICFGEGGAGTYSDGKLYTRKKDKLIPEVLERMVACGAPPSIKIDAKPHIGTNRLFRMLQNIRRELQKLGVIYHFCERVTGLIRQHSQVKGVHLASGGTLESDTVVLAIGHSARDTFEQLLAEGIPMEPKPFAVGVRAEHPQALIDGAQYHLSSEAKTRPRTLPPADYRLTAQTTDERGVWSFCMCPGGMIIPTSTEPDMMVVNGMSSARRSTPFANSGVVVHVGLDDLIREGFGPSPLAGVEFQRHIERRAFEAGGQSYYAPAMRAADLAARRTSSDLAPSHFRPGLQPADLREVLPEFIWRSIAEALPSFDNKIRGYASLEANLIAAETRTSSPIRIPRDPERFEVPQVPGLYVTGEGPGYAGGIMSAAIDGLRVAQAILNTKAS